MHAPRYFALTGAAGFVAPRHLKAIKDTGNELVAALDPHDSVGILDRYFPDADYFREPERFDRHLDRLHRTRNARAVDYVAICSPNYLHDAHVRLALRVGADAVCEKPLVLNPWNLDALEELERETGKRVFTVLQLRAHPALIELRQSLRSSASKRRKVSLTYITARGSWYRYSWKGDVEKSGGLATNIGVHFFDLLIWLFGPVTAWRVGVSDGRRVSGELELAGADVEWLLSVSREDLPAETVAAGKPTFRSIKVDGSEVEFSDGFTDLHTRIYEEILAGRGFGIAESRGAIELVAALRTAGAAIVR
jgi:UDP-N-acetyl-2-amino-2-deoxyglucuronate dehydrogenase